MIFMMKYSINRKVYDTYGVTPKLCILDSVHFFEFNSKKSEDANFICFASNKAVIEMALKKAEVYNIPLTYKQAETCLKNCKHSGELIKMLNYETKDDTPLCPLMGNKYVWMTTIRAAKTQEELDALRNKKTRAPFEVRCPELVPHRNRFMEVLKSRGIRVVGQEKKVELQIEKLLRECSDSPELSLHYIDGYLDFLESDEYAFQVENNKYTPRFTSIQDINGKFAKIRRFMHDERSWYDPSKHLKEKFN